MKPCRLFLLSFLLLSPLVGASAHAGEVLNLEKCARFHEEPLFVVLAEAENSWEESFKASSKDLKDEAKCASAAQGVADETTRLLTRIEEAKTATCMMEGNGSGDRPDSCCRALAEASRDAFLKKTEMIRGARKSCTNKAN